MLAIDLWAYRGDRPSRRSTLVWTIVWIAVGLAFGGLVWAVLGVQAAEEYYAAYAMEKGLSRSNRRGRTARSSCVARTAGR